MKVVFKPPGPVSRAFMLSPAFVRGLMGPVGSAKSSTCIMEMHRRQIGQEANERGWRMSRWAVIRNTNPMLRTTTIKTYEDWLKPDFYGPVKLAPPPFEHEIDVALPDGTRLVAEVIFLSLDRPEDMKKLLSLELTGAFANEARELPKTLIDGLTQRLRRYPAMKDGGPSWSGLIMDSNAPDEDHWWPIMAGMVPPPEGMSDEEVRQLVKPANWEFFAQPAAMLETRDERGQITGYEHNPDAENLKNLHPLYYSEMVAGKTKRWVDVYVRNQLGAVNDGRPVQGDFRRELHVAALPLDPVDGVPLIVGVDFGLTPAAAILQRVRGRWLCLREIVLADASAVDLAANLNRLVRDEFPGFKISVVWGDPAGDQRAGTDKKTPFQVLRAAGLPARPCESNDPELRRAAGRGPLARLVDGSPGIVFDARCKVLIAGLDGAWCYRRILNAAAERFDDEPQKNRYSHVCEGWEYAMLGAGEARAVMGREQPGNLKIANVRPTRDPLERFRQVRRGGRRARVLGR